MRKAHDDLPRYTWDQAAILNIWPATAYPTHFGVPAELVRSWATRNKIKPVGIGPNGHVLYLFDAVIKQDEKSRARRPNRPTDGRLQMAPDSVTMEAHTDSVCPKTDWPPRRG